MNSFFVCIVLAMMAAMVEASNSTATEVEVERVVLVWPFIFPVIFFGLLGYVVFATGKK